jgi:23S rRNA pseudouridine2605 synthase
LLTNDGTVAHRLQHPRFRIPREYEVVVQGIPARERIAQLLEGVRLDDGPARLLAAQIMRQNAGQCTVRVTLAEGRKREVRRLFEAVGHPVRRLLRVRYGPIALGSLPPGDWRPLSAAELAALND